MNPTGQAPETTEYYYSDNYLDSNFLDARLRLTRGALIYGALVLLFFITWILLLFRPRFAPQFEWTVNCLVILAIGVSLVAVFFMGMYYKVYRYNVNAAVRIIEMKGKGERISMSMDVVNIKIPMLVHLNGTASDLPADGEFFKIPLKSIDSVILLLEIKDKRISDKTLVLLYELDGKKDENDLYYKYFIENGFTVRIEELADDFIQFNIPVTVFWSTKSYDKVDYDNISRNWKPRYIVKQADHIKHRKYDLQSLSGAW